MLKSFITFFILLLSLSASADVVKGRVIDSLEQVPTDTISNEKVLGEVVVSANRNIIYRNKR